MKQKIIVLTFNYEPSQFPREPDAENRFFTYGFGGTFGRLIQNQIRKYEVEVWRLDGFCAGKKYEKNIDNVKFKVYRSFNIRKLGFFHWDFIKDLKSEKKIYDPIFFVVHTHNWQTYQIAYFLKGSKILTTHHGDWSPFFLYETSRGFRKLKALLGIIAEKLTFRYISYFLICDLEEIKYIKRAYPEMRFELFSTGLDIHRFKIIPKKEAKQILGLDENKKYILYVGKLYKYKQVDKLINIWLEIKKQKPDTELIIVGNEPEGKWGEEYYDLARSSGAAIIGRVLNTEIYRYYCACDVYVIMTLRDDYFGGTGIAPLESLACNTPVVANSLKNYLGNNVSEIGEIPKNEIEYRNAIIKVLNNPDKYTNMRNSVDKFYSWEAVAARMEKIFNILNK